MRPSVTQPSSLFAALVSLLVAMPVNAGSPGARGQSSEPAPKFLAAMASLDDFDRLARTYYRGRFYALPHLMFVIDRRANEKVYYVNSRIYAFHKDFVNATYLSLERGRAFYENNYLKDERRFLLGTIARQPSGEFTFEFWEADSLNSALLAETFRALRSTFFAELKFKPNSRQHQEAATELVRSAPARTPLLLYAPKRGEQEFQMFNAGRGIGQLRVVRTGSPDLVTDRNQIVIFTEVPLHLTPISGMITASPVSPLSHANMLARSWGIPAAFVKDADKLFAALEGKYVRLEVRDDGYRLAPAALAEIEDRQRQWALRTDLVTPRADLSHRILGDLRTQRARDSIRYGAKSANLGELMNSRVPGILVPAGFAIPFACYEEFATRNGLGERIREAVEEDRFVHDPRYRKDRLAEIRGWIQEGTHDAQFQRLVLAKVRRGFAGRSLFVRSSTNAEDLPDFSGAGLYTTIPNVRTGDQLMEAIKTVWASVWNYEAYEARESYGMNHFGVYPAVLVQEGIDAESAGVAVTTDPFDPENRDSVYINAKRGLGIRVVEGRRVAEQVLFRLRTGEIKVLTRSDDDTMIAFDDRGGVREVAIEPNRVVLTDRMIERLARAAERIKRVFGGRNQDIEWLYSRNRLYVVQSRPFIESQQLR
jgi:hypothetical protein